MGGLSHSGFEYGSSTRETYLPGSASPKLERYTIDHIEVAGTSNQF